MIDIWGAFTNPTLQAFVFSPLMGTVFAVLFSGLSRPHVPVVPTVSETRRIYIEKHYYHRKSRSSDEDDRSTAVMLLVAMLFVVWQYSLHAFVIQQTLITVLATGLYFSLVSVFIAFWKGHITSNGWMALLFIPTGLLFAGLVLALRARSTFPVEVTELAEQYEFVQFYMKGLSEYGRYYMITHVVGIACLFSLVVVCFMSLLHALALMNQRDYRVDSFIWDSVIRFTEWTSSTRGFVLQALTVVGALLLLEGFVTRWIM
ncbi:hypothetical protein WNY58_09105 [Neptuniibacter pectenicola]|jgi:hypothetical protein|uniref:Uncharacterized protein n=1 Tax=Neptuniibacter pectenicola TaxID=1806669 RepID=A0ABU9TTM9_9GAMM